MPVTLMKHLVAAAIRALSLLRPVTCSDRNQADLRDANGPTPLFRADAPLNAITSWGIFESTHDCSAWSSAAKSVRYYDGVHLITQYVNCL
jgi:hypothetical protein